MPIVGDARMPLPDRTTARSEAPDALRRDVRLLAELLGSILLESAGREVLDSVEELRRAAIAARSDPGLMATCDELVERWPPERAELVARAFTCYFHLANLAEEQHRQRALDARARSGAAVAGSLDTTIAELRRTHDEEWVRRHVARLAVHPVLTAHPTEARRPELISALRRVAHTLERLDDPRSSAADLADARGALLEGIEDVWRTSEVRGSSATVLDEARAATAVLDDTLFEVVADLYRAVDTVLEPVGAGTRPPIVAPFIRFGTWAGGDRDGNPFVSARATEQVMAELLGRGITAIERSVRSIVASLRPEGAEAPPRERLAGTLSRLRATREGGDDEYADPQELVAELRALQRSLATGGARRLAYGSLQRLIWQIGTFGFTLCELEIRQHARVHAAALMELERGAPSPAAREVLETLRVMRRLQERYGANACHRYVVSFTRDAADVAAVHALAAQLPRDERPELDVVPLFETLEDIRHAASTVEHIVALPASRRRLDENGRRIEVMLGYSDSAKESGSVPATFALYEAQEQLVTWATARDVHLTIFHGRGGALGRGGGPANRAILAQAPGSMSGGFKVTEQGEVIFARYGNHAIARRHLEQVASAVLVASDPGVEALTAQAARRWRALMARLEAAARRAYRELIEAEGFCEWLARVSPLDEVDQLRIGSRTARRGGGRSFEDLRAIPWVFAWAQTRLNLPGWYGLGTAVASVDRDVLRDAYSSWPLFAALIDNAEMSLAKTDREIASRHLALGERPDLTERVLGEYDRTLAGILEIIGEERLLERRPVLAWAVALRNPYVDALSHLQLRALRGLRGDAADELRPRYDRLLLLTMNGIAAGLQNTG